ncbi:uncharacterized protein [Montipora capricornis]|uniref:uncharacterized protein n=1 Tax=Montipora capricornis TaxID=246305 RepID=UPI0035F190D1
MATKDKEKHPLSPEEEDEVIGDEPRQQGQTRWFRLAEIINKQWSVKLPDSKLKDRYGKYLRPLNCETLTTPRVNPEIWDKLSHSAKQHDPRSSSTQKTLATVGALLYKSTELIMKHTQESNFHPDLKTLIKINTDAVTLLGHAHIEMSHRQRESIKPHFNKEYAGLCASHVPVTTFLFGDDLQARLNSIQASNRIGGAVENRQNYKNYYRGNFPWKSDKRGRQPLLGKSRQWKPHQRSYSRQDQGKKQP